MLKRGTLWMAALLALLALAALAPDAALAEEVTIDETNFPDANFRDYVNQFDTSQDGYLSAEEIARVTEIDVYNKQSITTLTGIEYFTELTSLNCSGNNLTELNVSSNTKLTSLHCSRNQLTALVVSSNTELTSLDCSGNNLTELNVSSNTKLTSLHCSRNQLTELNVSSNTKLTSLDCSGNNLTALNVSSNAQLTSLHCFGNQLTELVVSDNTELTSLDCSGNNLTALNVSSNTELTELDCSRNQLEGLDVSSNAQLTSLHCSGNQLTELVVSDNAELKILICSENQLTELNVSSNTELTELDCSRNQLEGLDVSSNAQLTSLHCFGNQLTELVVSGNAKLKILICSENQLTELNVSSNTELTYLDCSGNQLTALDVSGNADLVILVCSNQKAELNVDRANDNWSVNLSEEIGAGVTSVNLSGSHEDSQAAKVEDTTVSWNRGRVKVSYQYKTGYQESNQETLMDVTLTLIPNGAKQVTSIKEVTVDGIAGDISDTTITVKLPAGTGLPTDTNKIGIIPTDGPKAVASTPTTEDGGKTWTFTVTAEDGQTQTVYTLRVLPAYTVTVTSDDGEGSVTIEGAQGGSAWEGDTITLAATPNDGYVFDRWEVTEGGVTIENNTFAMPAKNVSITAKWAQDAPPYAPPTPVAPPEIDFTPGGDQPGGDEPGGDQPASVELEPGQSATLDLGVVDNYAAFAAAGVEIVATPVCDAGMTASAAIDQSGRILLNLYAIEPGEHQVSVTLSAAGCQPVTVAQITLTVPEAQPEDPEDPDAPDLPDIQPQEGTQAYTGVQGVTHLSLSQGTVVFTLPDLAGTEGVVWKSSKPKVVSIDPQTGEAQLKKSGTATLTATLPDGTTITQKVNVHKKDFAQPDTIRLQTKVNGKWTDVPEEGIVVVPKKSGQKSVPTRLVGDGGEIIIESIEADKALLTRSSGNPAPVKIKKRSLTDGQTTTLIIKANGQEFTLPITIDSTAKDLYPDPLPSEIQSILQQEE